MANRLTELMAEANRRRVFRTAGVYLVAVWGVSQGAAELGPLFGIPDWTLRYGVISALAFLPVVVVLAWMFDIGRSGIVRDPADLLADQNAEDELARMPTLLGVDSGGGSAVIVRWNDAQRENAVLYWDEFFIGRGVDCRVRFYDPLVSRKHARVFQEDGAWFIEDLGSRNGTSLEDKKIVRQSLSGTHEVRVNDAGPLLQIECLKPGAETRAALASFPNGQPTAHVRSTNADSATSSRAIQRN